MTDTVTAEQIAGLVEALEHSADLTRNESPYHTDPAETLYRQAAQALTALQERVEGLERELAEVDAIRGGNLRRAFRAEARADALSAELERLKKGLDGRQTINQPLCGVGPSDLTEQPSRVSGAGDEP